MDHNNLRPGRALLLGIMGALALSGCMSAGEVNFERFTLTQDVQPEAYLHNYDIKLDLAPILDQGGVVMQMSEVTLRPAKNFRYSSSLSDELSLLLSDELLKAKAPQNLSYEAFVAKFQGTAEGQALVTVAFKVRKRPDPITPFTPINQGKASPQPPELFAQTYEHNSTLTADGYSVLVLALKANFRAAAHSFAQDLKARL